MDVVITGEGEGCKGERYALKKLKIRQERSTREIMQHAKIVLYHRPAVALGVTGIGFAAREYLVAVRIAACHWVITADAYGNRVEVRVNGGLFVIRFRFHRVQWLALSTWYGNAQVSDGARQ